jgi:hypothetical protein
MKIKAFFIVLVVFTISCASTINNSQEDESYGYSKDNPIKVGGGTDGPKNERNYLNSLTGPNGEAVSYIRKGSCCHFKTKNSSFGGGALDIYKVTYSGKNDTITLYLNMYDKDKIKAPKGFLIRE